MAADLVYGKRDQAVVDADWYRNQEHFWRGVELYAKEAMTPAGPSKGLYCYPEWGPGTEIAPVKLQAQTAENSSVQPVELDVFFRWAECDDDCMKPALLHLHGAPASQDLGGVALLSYDTWWVKLCPKDLVVIIPHCPDSRRSPWVRKSVKATLLYAVEYAIARGVDPSRVYVSGYSMGAFGVWDLAMDSAVGKAPFAAAVPISGYPLDEDRVLDLAGFPLWCFHGANDMQNSVKGDDEAIARIAAVTNSSCQGPESKLRYTRYDWSPAVMDNSGEVAGHATHEQVFSDQELFAWLLRQTSDDQSGHEAQYRSRRPRPSKFANNLKITNVPGRRDQVEVDKRWIRQRIERWEVGGEQFMLLAGGMQQLAVKGSLPITPRRFQAPKSMVPRRIGFSKQSEVASDTTPPILDFFIHKPPLLDGSEMFNTGRPALLYLHGASGCVEEYGIYGLSMECWWLHLCPQELVVIVPQTKNKGMHWLNRNVKATLWYAIQTLLEEGDIDPWRIYVSGYSMGGTAAWEFAVESTQHMMPFQGFAAAVLVTPMIMTPEKAEVLKDFPLWIFHAANEWPVIQKIVKDAIDQCIGFGANSGPNATLRYTCYDWSPGSHDFSGFAEGHASNEQAYGEPEMWTWLLRQIRSEHAHYSIEQA